jgi:hypothetical protein
MSTEEMEITEENEQDYQGGPEQDYPDEEAEDEEAENDGSQPEGLDEQARRILEQMDREGKTEWRREDDDTEKVNIVVRDTGFWRVFPKE